MGRSFRGTGSNGWGIMMACLGSSSAENSRNIGEGYVWFVLGSEINGKAPIVFYKLKAKFLNCLPQGHSVGAQAKRNPQSTSVRLIPAGTVIE